MKKFLVLISIMCFSLSAFAMKDGDLNFNTGIGIFGSRGMFGVSGDRFFSPNHALSVALGIDFIGVTSTVGYKYFTDKVNTSGTVWDKCWFAFECDMHNYYGASLQHAGKTSSKFSESDVLLREYETESKVLGVATFGRRDVYKNNLTFDWEITYRSLVSGGKSVQTSGAPGDDQKALEMGYRNIGAGFAFGYLF